MFKLCDNVVSSMWVLFITLRNMTIMEIMDYKLIRLGPMPDCGFSLMKKK